VQPEPERHQTRDNRQIVRAKIADPVEWQKALPSMPVDDKFGKHHPPKKKGAKRGEFDDRGQISKMNSVHVIPYGRRMETEFR
jgi:hypothetical protein